MKYYMFKKKKIVNYPKHGDCPDCKAGNNGNPHSKLIYVPGSRYNKSSFLTLVVLHSWTLECMRCGFESIVFEEEDKESPNKNPGISYQEYLDNEKIDTRNNKINQIIK